MEQNKVSPEPVQCFTQLCLLTVPIEPVRSVDLDRLFSLWRIVNCKSEEDDEKCIFLTELEENLPQNCHSTCIIFLDDEAKNKLQSLVLGKRTGYSCPIYLLIVLILFCFLSTDICITWSQANKQSAELEIFPTICSESCCRLNIIIFLS